MPTSPWDQAGQLLDAGFDTDDSVGRLVTGPPTGPGAGTEHLASGPLGAVGTAGQRESSAASGSVLVRHGPWLAVGAAGLVVLAGAVMALRSRR